MIVVWLDFGRASYFMWWPGGGAGREANDVLGRASGPPIGLGAAHKTNCRCGCAVVICRVHSGEKKPRPKVFEPLCFGP
jgi:hypothetical protein